MHKLDITTLFTGVFSAVLVANAITLDALHQAQADNAHSNMGNTNLVDAGRLPETKKLLRDDNLLPTMNRTQAMRLEAETGHLNEAADKVLAPRRAKAPSRQPAHVARRPVTEKSWGVY